MRVFWNNHNPVGRAMSSQYASIIFYHNEEQKRVAEETKERQQNERERSISTEIVAYSEFWRAEDYHQKYYLRGAKELVKEFEAAFPSAEAFVDSTATARVNGYVGGHGTMEQLKKEIDRLGLSDQGQERLQEIAEKRLR